MKRYRICVPRSSGSVLFLMLSTGSQVTAPKSIKTARAMVLGGPNEYLFKASSTLFSHSINYSHNVNHRQVKGLLSRSSF